jgi:starch phosphorylase
LKRVLSPDALTIGLRAVSHLQARQPAVCATSKRLTSFINHPQMPVQIVFAGKAHPQDGPARRCCRRSPGSRAIRQFFGKLVFIEDYDINVGRHLVRASTSG